MLGAITGDIAGSLYENLRTKRKDFKVFHPLSFFTDDTVLTVAVAHALLDDLDLGQTIKRYAWRRPMRGYGPKFYRWMIFPGSSPYNSLGNGSAMRVSAVSYIAKDFDDVLRLAKRTAECTHNHPEGIKGAQAVAYAVYAARTGHSKEDIRSAVSDRFGYDLSRTVDEIRPGYKLNLTCPGSVPEAIIAFLDSMDYEDAIRNAVSLGGDADTQAAISGAIAEAYYGGVPMNLARTAWCKIPNEYRSLISRFHKAHPLPTQVDAGCRRSVDA